MVLNNKQGEIKGGTFAQTPYTTDSTKKVYAPFRNQSKDGEWKRFRKMTFATGGSSPHMGHEVTCEESPLDVNRHLEL